MTTVAISDDLLRRYDVPAPRYTSYPTVPAWSTSFDATAHGAALDRSATRPGPLSVYVHLPFCRALCDFCGCNVVVSRDAERIERYLDLLERELDLVTARLGARRAVSQIHWGGGTPTSLDVRQLERLGSALADRFVIEPDAEQSVEIDPRVTTSDQLRALKAMGFGRLSLGVQDLDASVQAAIGRHQSADQTRAAVENARTLGFRGVSIDLVYGLPRQTSQSWQRTIDEVIALRPDRIAVYAFAHVPALRPQQRRLPIAELPTARDKLSLLGIARERLERAGWRAVGMDHFVAPGDDLDDAARLHRNFQGYTSRRADEVIAFGASAISDFGEAFAQNAPRLGDYRAAIEAGRLATTRGLWLDDDDRRRRAIISQLMCALRVDLGDVADFAPELARLRDLQSDGLVQIDGASVIVTEVGRLFLRNVAAVFDARTAAASAPLSRAV